ncbi:LysR family transcriptional regulator [Bowmanella pacifica]|nr:LysR family transcriptional regulator [Bowmanella pacifica]
MKIDSIGYFLEVAKHSSISMAARSLQVNRTTISMAIAAMEDELNAQLFERQGNRLSLSATGTLILDQCQRIVSSYNILKRQAYEGPDSMGQTLRLGRDDVLPERFWRTLLKEITARQPFVNVKMMYSSPEHLIQLVRDGEIDVAYFTMDSNHNLNVSDLVMRVTGQIDMTMMAAKSHPLSQLKRVANQDLDMYPQVTYLNSANQECFHLPGIGENRIALSSFELVRDGVLDNLGWGYLPMTLLSQEHLATLHPLNHGMSRQHASFYACRRAVALGGEDPLSRWLEETLTQRIMQNMDAQ